MAAPQDSTRSRTLRTQAWSWLRTTTSVRCNGVAVVLASRRAAAAACLAALGQRYVERAVRGAGRSGVPGQSGRSDLARVHVRPVAGNL